MTISVTPERKRVSVRGWFDTAIEAVDPRSLVKSALKARESRSTVIAIGKASVAMAWGAHEALGDISGICVSNDSSEPPPGVELVVGDHPLPGTRSFAAGRRVLEVATAAQGPIVALISGGGSALCELPLPGIEPEYLAQVNRILLRRGAPISETNLIRRHLSAIKCGGVARAAGRPVETLVLSDVNGGGAHLVASGPTIPSVANPDRAEQLMTHYGIPVDESIRATLKSATNAAKVGPIAVIADGRTAGAAVVERARVEGHSASLNNDWLNRRLMWEVNAFINSAGPGVRVAVGEPMLEVSGTGLGGRNTHAALVAATLIADTDTVFAAFASDGVDGSTDTAGAIVDGRTLRRGGDPTMHLANFDSATYLEKTGDLVRTGPTGTNVADLWLAWKS